MASWLPALRLRKPEGSSNWDPETALYSSGVGWATRALARRLVLPSCTALPLAARSLFTRSPANQRARSGAWTRSAPGGENGCCAPKPHGEEGAEGGGAASLGPGGRRTSLTLKMYPGLVAFGGRVRMLQGWERRLEVTGNCAYEGISCLALVRTINLEAPVYSRLTNR